MIFVLAGVNGAGKSSIGGAAIRNAGQDWFNPDEIARELHRQFPDRPLEDINSQVWREGLFRLQAAVRNDTQFAFETTLGGNTITATLLDAIALGRTVRVWYCGLASAELHIQRVAARVARGGHDIPEDLIRSRYRSSMQNLCRLTPGLARLAVYDNSAPLDEWGRPCIRRLIDVNGGKIRHLTDDMPAWAKPVAGACLAHWKKSFEPG